MDSFTGHQQAGPLVSSDHSNGLDWLIETIFYHLMEPEAAQNHLRRGYGFLFICPRLWTIMSQYSFATDYGDELPNGASAPILRTTGLLIMTASGRFTPNTAIELLTRGDASRARTVSAYTVRTTGPPLFDVKAVVVQTINVTINTLVLTTRGPADNVIRIEDNSCDDIFDDQDGCLETAYVWMSNRGCGLSTYKLLKDEIPTVEPADTIFRIAYEGQELEGDGVLTCFFTSTSAAPLYSSNTARQ